MVTFVAAWDATGTLFTDSLGLPCRFLLCLLLCSWEDQKYEIYAASCIYHYIFG